MFFNESLLKCVEVHVFKSQHGKCSHVDANFAFLRLIGTSAMDFESKIADM